MASDRLYQFVWGIGCALLGGHDWLGGSAYVSDRPGYHHRTRAYCRRCGRAGPWRYVTQEEFTRDLADSIEAYHKGSPWLEEYRLNADGSTERVLARNPDYDLNWKPSTEAQELVATYNAAQRGLVSPTGR